MWNLSGSGLPTTTPKSRIANAPGMPIATFRRSDWSNPRIPIASLRRRVVREGQAVRPEKREVATPTAIEVGSTVVPVTVEIVKIVRSGGKAWTPSVDYEATPGTFRQNPAEGTVTLYTDDDWQPGDAVEVSGESRPADQILTNYIPPPYPDWFSLLPIGTDISINGSAEQHPSGSLSIKADDSNIDTLRELFYQGTYFTMFGIGFAVSSFSETQPETAIDAGIYEVSISLTGKHAAPCDAETLLLDESEPSGSGDAVDPECKILNQVQSEKALRPKSITLRDFAARAGTSLIAPDLSIPIPPQIAAGTTSTLSNELNSRARIQGCFLEYANGDAVCMKNLSEVRTWTYNDKVIQGKPTLTYQGNRGRKALSVPRNLIPEILKGQDLPVEAPVIPPRPLKSENASLLAPGAEFPRVRLEGRFSSPTEEDGTENRDPQQSPARWKKRKPLILTLAKGDIDPEVCPIKGTIKKIDMLFDSSGRTKTVEFETTEDGTPIYSVSRTYGCVFLSKDHIATLPGNRKRLRVQDPASTWGLVKEEIREYVYDATTGYLIAVPVRGQELRRYYNESDSLETYKLSKQIGSYSATNPPAITPDSPSAARKAAKLSCYHYEWVPVFGIKANLLRSLRLDFPDIPPPPRNSRKSCLPDGRSTLIYEGDPTYVDPMRVVLEADFNTSFSSRSSPEKPTTVRDEDTGISQKVEPPPLTKGRESFNRSETRVYPAIYRKGKKIEGSEDLYTSYTNNCSAEGPDFSQVAESASFSEGKGRPGEGQRKPSLWEQDNDQPEPIYSVTRQPKQNNPNQFEYWLCSPGYDLSKPEKGSQSYPLAETVEQAFMAAKTDWVINDCKSAVRSLGIQVPANIQVRCFDAVNAVVRNTFYPSRVNAWNHSLKVMSSDDVGIVVQGTTQLTLTPKREPPVNLLKRPKPADSSEMQDGAGGQSEEFSGDARVRPRGFEMGSIIPEGVVNRGSF